MAVKLPPDAWIGQVLTLKGFKDNVYSKIDGSLIGYVKDGKFVQTVDKLPVVEPKKKAVQDKAYNARIKQIFALNAIPSMELDAEYYRSVAENPKKTSAERKKALTEYRKLESEIAAKKKEAEVAADAASSLSAKKKADEITKTAGKRAAELEKEYAKLQADSKLIIDPKSGSAENLKNKMDKLVTEYRSVYSKLVGSPISLTAARLQIKSKLPKPVAATKPTGATGPTGAKATGPTGGATGPTGAKATGPTIIKPGVSTGSRAGDEQDKAAAAKAAEAAAASVGIPTAKPTVKTPLDVLLRQTEFWYDLPDYIFKLDS